MSPLVPAPVPVTNLTVSIPFNCSAQAAANLVTDETNGTFGTGTTAQTRATSSANVTGYTFAILEAYPDSTQYQYTDAILPATGASVYYRIQMVNNDENTDFSNVIAINTALLLRLF